MDQLDHTVLWNAQRPQAAARMPSWPSSRRGKGGQVRDAKTIAMSHIAGSPSKSSKIIGMIDDTAEAGQRRLTLFGGAHA